MSRDPVKSLTGIHAATIVPMKADFSIDEVALVSHLKAVTAVPGIRGLLLNGHAGENFTLCLSEKRRIVEIARQVVPDDCYLVSGVNHESSLEAVVEARTMEEAGADALLVFPPNSWALSHADDVIINHHEHILAATACPVMVYGAPVGAGHMAYSPDVLRQLVRMDRIVGIKDGSWEVAHYEANRRLLKGLRPEFVVMGSGDEHLLTSYLIGSEGSQVSLAVLIPDLLCALYTAVQKQDWATARALHEKIYPLSVAVYRDPPGGRATARLKTGLHILGRVSCNTLRPPQPAASNAEYAALEAALKTALA